MSTIDGGEVVVRAMQAQGIEMMFTISDIAQSPMLRSAEAAGMRLVAPRHESAGVHMADGWARASGGLAAAAGAAGPGVANMVPGLVCASVEGVPLLAIGTQRVRRSIRSARRGRFQFAPQLEVVAPVTKFAARVDDAVRLPEFVAEAVRHARSGRPGPSFLEIPSDVLLEEVDEDEVTIGDPARAFAAPSAPDPASVAAAARMLREARFPVILAGHGVHRGDGAAEPLRVLAEQTGALVMTTAGAQGAFPGSHPQSVGMVFPWGTPAHLDADVVLAVGTQLGESTQYLLPPAWAGPDTQKLVHLDRDPLQIGVNRDVDVALIGDAAAGLSALVTALADEPARPPAEDAASYAAGYHAFRRDVIDGYAAIDSAPVHPGRLAVELADALPDDTVLCMDGGNTGLWASLAFTREHPRSLLWTGHLGHLGTGLPYAIGAKLACPQRPVVLFTGDGAFGFNLQELETAARERLAVVVVINCDYAWGMEELYMEKVAGTTVNVKQSEVRYDEVARALGCRGELIDTPDGLRPALDRALAADGPTVIQVVVDDRENVHPPGLDEFLGMYDAEQS